MSPGLSHSDLYGLLAWYRDAGVDEPLLNEPIDRFAESDEMTEAARTKQLVQTGGDAARLRGKANPLSNRSPTPAHANPAPAVPRVAVPDEKAIAKARELAASCETLEALHDAIRSFEGCGLRYTAKSTVFADGAPESTLMIVGDGPNRDEDADGKPFSGQAGEMLTRMLTAIGLAREDTYLATILPWRTPGERPATPYEIALCAPFIERHVALATPSLLLTMGGAAAKILLREKTQITALRGSWKDTEIGSHKVPVLPTFHPSYLIRHPDQKRLVWSDLLMLKERIEDSSDGGGTDSDDSI